MRNRDARWVVPLASLLLTANSSSAATIRVPADAPTIQAGIDAAAAGDSVLVAPGTYTGTGNKNLDFNGRDIVLTSESGAASTIIDVRDCPDCSYEGRGFIFHRGETSSAIVEGFTVQHGFFYDHRAEPGGALQIQTAAPTIRGCVFIENGRREFAAAGAVACLSNARPTFADCMFVRNVSHGPGGAIYSVGSQVTITDCVFDSNLGGGGGALWVEGGTLVVTGSTFRYNTMDFQQGAGGAIVAHGTVMLESCTLYGNGFGAVFVGGENAEIRGCTFYGNDGTTFGDIVGSHLNVGSGGATIWNSIFAFGGKGPAIMGGFGGGDCTATCTDIFGNDGGDWVDCVEGQNGINGNISADPLFCGGGYPDHDFRLDERSPCAPDNSGGCGLIGAHDVGCRTTAINPTTWGHLKWMWRPSLRKRLHDSGLRLRGTPEWMPPSSH